MHAEALRQLLDDVAAGAVPVDDAVAQLRRLPFADLGFARVDHHRALRQGLAEAVYGPGKTPEQCAAVVAELLAGSDEPVLLTRADDAQTAAAIAANPGGVVTAGRSGSTVVWRPAPIADGDGRQNGQSSDISPGDGDGEGPRRRNNPTVAVVAAGTADLPVADEAAAVLAAHGVAPIRLNDVGVAGLHRLLESVDVLVDADIVIVVAGMEGALASVVGGIVAAPVIAVPTSVGYGSAMEGVTALLAMMSSCAAGVSVVGIDNGYGAAVAALRLRNALTSPARHEWGLTPFVTGVDR